MQQFLLLSVFLSGGQLSICYLAEASATLTGPCLPPDPSARRWLPPVSATSGTGSPSSSGGTKGPSSSGTLYHIVTVALAAQVAGALVAQVAGALVAQVAVAHFTTL